jgi:Spy/CpxP family protein refolding chaperone
MRIRNALMAAAIAAVPALALAQTDTNPAPTTPPAAASPATPDGTQHRHAAWHKRHAEMRAKYDQLSAADKAKFDELTKQIRTLRQQQREMLGIKKS